MCKTLKPKKIKLILIKETKKYKKFTVKNLIKN